MVNKNSSYGFIVLGILLAACAVMAAAGSARYGTLSDRTYACDTGMGHVQDMADLLASSAGDTDVILDAFPEAFTDGGGGSVVLLLDGDLNACGDWSEAEYEILASRPVRKNGLGSSEIKLTDRAGMVLFEITASWQEAF